MGTSLQALVEVLEVMTKDERLTKRTIRLIEQHKLIILKRKDGCYLGQHTLIQAGMDAARWTTWRVFAMDVDNLKWAFSIAKLYGCKVYSYKPYRNKK